MLIGVSTAIMWDYKKLNIPEAIIHSVDDLGFEAVEIHCESPFFKGWGTEKAEKTKKEVKEVLSTVETSVSLHAPYHDCNIATLNRGIEKEVISQLKECIETADYLGTDIVVVHPGFIASRKYERKMVFNKMVDNFKKITSFAENFGVKICMENLSSKKKAMCVGIPEIKKVLDRVNMKNLKLNLDIAHANTTKTGPLEYVKELKEYIAHVHVSDNTGEDDHLTLGQGNIDFKKVLSKLRPFNGIVTVEGWIPENEDPFLKYSLSELQKIRNSFKS